MECEGWAPGSVTNPTQQPGDLSQPRFPYDKGSTLYDVREILEFWALYNWFCTGSSKKILLSSVTHVPSGLMGCALAA